MINNFKEKQPSRVVSGFPGVWFQTILTTSGLSRLTPSGFSRLTPWGLRRLTPSGSGRLTPSGLSRLILGDKWTKPFRVK